MDQIRLLIRLGFTEYEARAYLALARLGPSTVREIVLDSKLPRNKAYEALQRLDEKGRVVSIPFSPKKYKIADPVILEEEVKDMHDTLNQLVKMVETPKAREFKDLFWVLKGRDAIVEKIRMENAKAKREILSCSYLDKMLYKNMRVMRETTRRGVKVYFITSFQKKNVRVYKAWLETGVKIRFIDKSMFGPLIARISVFDNCKARLTIGKPEVEREEDYITLWTESRAFSQMLRNHFMNMWRHSELVGKYLKKD